MKDKSGNSLNDNSLVKTGDTITFNYNGEFVTYTLSVLGDVTGDGIIKIVDVARIYKHYKSSKDSDKITDAATLAAAKI